MIEAINTLISKTIDIFLKINSSEHRRRKFSKDIYQVYNELINVSSALEKIDNLILIIDKQNPLDDFEILFKKELEFLQNSFGKIAGILSAESWDLFQINHQPELLKAINIYDTKLVDTFNHAWFLDGGFVELLYRLKIVLPQKRILKLIDKEFNPNNPTHGYAIKPKDYEFNLDKKSDRNKFKKILLDCKNSVDIAIGTVKDFIAKNLSIEDII